LNEIKLFFGPSRQFKNIFLRALLLANKFKDKSTRRVFELKEEPIFL